jgi:dihydrofolate reductase
LQLPGSVALSRWLLENELVDEMTLFICPVVVGQGTRLFPEVGQEGRSSSSNREPPRAG